MSKSSISVPEMQRILGLGKTESYWLVKKNYFKTIIIAGKMRVMVDSFEEWYTSQLHYKKVDGTPQGSKWTKITWSIKEAADILGVSTWLIYKLINQGAFEIVQVGQATRIYKDSFEKWYVSQNRYKKAFSQEDTF